MNWYIKKISQTSNIIIDIKSYSASIIKQVKDLYDRQIYTNEQAKKTTIDKNEIIKIVL